MEEKEEEEEEKAIVRSAPDGSDNKYTWEKSRLLQGELRDTCITQLSRNSPSQ